jgi:molybdate transport system substrate-binding protein
MDGPMPQPAKRLCLLLLALLAMPAAARAAEVGVAVASNFAAPMRVLAPAFERATGYRAVVALGSTGALYAQVRNGAPFDVLLSADDETPARLEREGLAVPGSRFTYATGRLVLWSAQAGVVDDQGAVLRNPGAQRLALANPKLAPYGAAAAQALAALGLWEAWRPRVVQGDNIAQAHAFVATGNATLGLVALSQVTVDGRIASGSGWVVPASLHEPIRQDAVLLSRGRGKAAAEALMAYLRSDAAAAVIRAHGYER